MWNLVPIEKSNEAQIFIAARWLSKAHLHQILFSFELYFGSYGLFFEVYRICQKCDNYLIDQKSLWLNGLQVGIMFIRNWGIQVWFWVDLEVIVECTRSRLWSILNTYLVLKLEDQDQTQDGDEVLVLIIIGNLLV